MSAKRLASLAWGISLISVLLAFTVWINNLGWDFTRSIETAYNTFPLFGLAAFSLMWSHYIVGSLRRFYGFDKQALTKYFKGTSVLVLICILAHPLLLMLQLYLDGFGLPPQSYLEHYVAPSLAWAAGLGTISLIIFLLFELYRKFNEKSWWKYIDYAQILAMGFIFLHGLTLGRHLQFGWYKWVWYFYGISLIFAIIYNFKSDQVKEKI